MKGLIAASQQRAALDESDFFDFEEREGAEVVEGSTSQEKLQDADFFNKFDDDFDETDMKLQ
jgi:hypothetical protein